VKLSIPADIVRACCKDHVKSLNNYLSRGEEINMLWQEIRERYPQQWLLVEAIKARSEATKRIVEELSVVNTFSDSAIAMQAYIQLHREFPGRELLVLHISRQTIDIT
jgi:hypothetical protein